MGTWAGLWGYKTTMTKTQYTPGSELGAFVKVTVEAFTPNNYKQGISQSRDQTILMCRLK